MYSKFNKVDNRLQVDEDALAIKIILTKFMNNWYLFVISMFICFGLAAVYGYFTSAEWKISGRISFLNQKDNLAKVLSNNKGNTDASSFSSDKSSTDHVIAELKSHRLMVKLVQQLELNVRTYAKSGLKYQEIYKTTPFAVTIHLKHDTINEQTYLIEIKDNTHYRIKNSREDLDQIDVFGKTVKLPQFTFLLNKTTLLEKRGKYKIRVQSPDAAVSELLKNFRVKLSNKQVASIDLALNYPNAQKGETILNKLMSVYLYNNLLGKNSIADSTTRLNNKRLAINMRIIGAAKSDLLPFKPKKSTFYIFSLILGLFLPTVYLIIEELFSIRIHTKSDIQKLTSIPIIGEISHQSDERTLVSEEFAHTIISGKFKSMCACLQSILNSKKSNVLLFTSSMSGEGKTFVALNIGSSLALSGKKVVFIELDLRKPKLSESIGLDNSYGYTNYAISDTVTIDDILKPLWFHQNCFLVSSGAVPPNPSELLTSDKLEKTDK